MIDVISTINYVRDEWWLTRANDFVRMVLTRNGGAGDACEMGLLLLWRWCSGQGVNF